MDILVKCGTAGLPLRDLDFICADLAQNVEHFRSKEILIYGGTGFIGKWLVAGLLHSNEQLGMDARLTVVTRDVRGAQRQINVPKGEKVKFIQHDLVLSAPIEEITADFVFHAATPTMKVTGSNNPKAVVASTVNAANHAANLSSRNNDKPMVIHLSSGAVYGPQPMDMELRLETDKDIYNSESSYTRAKLAAENILFSAYTAGKILYQSPRLFAFAGPFIPLDAHFAVGNFVKDGLSERAIKLTGSPLTRRSYLYPVDLVNILLRTTKINLYENFNIGSDQSVSMFELGELVSHLTSKKGVSLDPNNSVPTNYVPDISFVRDTMQYPNILDLDSGLERWIAWLSREEYAENW